MAALADATVARSTTGPSAPRSEALPDICNLLVRQDAIQRGLGFESGPPHPAMMQVFQHLSGAVEAANGTGHDRIVYREGLCASIGIYLTAHFGRRSR